MKKLFTLFTVLFLSFVVVHAQGYNPDNINKKAKALFAQGLERADDGNMPMAMGLVQQAINADNKYVDAYLALAAMNGNLKNYANSIKLYEQAFALDSVYTLDYKIPYSTNLAGSGDFSKALNAINEVLSKKPPKNENSLRSALDKKKNYEFAVNYAKEHSAQTYIFAPVNMGPNINSTESEYFPCFTIDGKELIFTRRLRGANEDFFSSHLVNGQWEPAQPVPGDVNTDENEGAQNISQDGQWLFFTACNRRDGFGGCDIYMSFLEGNKWSEAIDLGGRVNSNQWESQPCLSPDKKDLYFASRRPGGYGGSDIYVCHLQPNGRWSDPENLGPQLNTAGDEQCPFIHADNQTLYFTSNIWPGYGDDDLFYVRKGPGGNWSKPVNLGYPINTIGREGTLFIKADGKTAYYASDRADSRGGLDIYSFELREDVRPFKTLWVKGQVLDKKTGAGLPSSVELIDLGTRQTFSKIQTDEKGNYLVTLPLGKDYAFNVNRKGYLFYSDNFSLSKNAPDSVFEKNIPLQPIEANASIVLKNVFFDVNKFDLQPASLAELDKLVQLMTDNPTLRIQIGGHTDSIGKATDNLKLSENRAKAVVSYLVSKGIAVTRLTAKGFGSTIPVAANKTEEGRAMNRRTEMKVVSQ